MSLATYADLQAAVPKWSNRTDLATLIPDFIALAEARISADLTSRALEKVQTVTITAGFAALPEDVIEIRGLRIGGVDLEAVSRERIAEMVERGQATSRPYFALVGRQVQVYGSTGTALEVWARCRVPALATFATNWVLTGYPNVYLFGALIEVAAYLKNDADTALWSARYREAIAQANRAIEYSGGTGRMKARWTP